MDEQRRPATANAETPSSGDIAIREATEGDGLGVVRLLDAALLAMEYESVVSAIERGNVLVADHGDRVVGAVVLSPRESGVHVEAIAVQRERRNHGIGQQLVEAAVGRYERVTADFRPEIEPFWASLGFAVERRDERLWGERSVDTS